MKPNSTANRNLLRARSKTPRVWQIRSGHQIPSMPSGPSNEETKAQVSEAVRQDGTLVVCGCWEGIVTLEMVGSSWRVYGKLKDLGIGSLGSLKMFSCHPLWLAWRGASQISWELWISALVVFSVGNRQAIHVCPEKRDWFLKRVGWGFPKCQEFSFRRLKNSSLEGHT